MGDINLIFKNKRCLALVSTPFQLMSLLCMIGDYDFENVSSLVLVIDGDFANAEIIEDRIKREGLFDNVLVSAKHEEYENHLGIRYLKDSIFRAASLKKEFNFMFPELDGLCFDVLLCSCATRSSLVLKRFCVPEGQTIFFDDGVGSHSAMVFHPLGCFDNNAIRIDEKNNVKCKEKIRNSVRRIILLCLPASSRFNISAIFLFSPTSATVERMRSLKVHTISSPKINFQLLSRIFNYEMTCGCSSQKYIFFTLPGDVSKIALTEERHILEELISCCGEDLHIRVHPRRNSTDFSWCAGRVDYTSFWELEAGSGVVSNDTWLIGSCSTAQSSPKVIFDIEPYQILLHELVSQVSYASCVVFLKDLQESYNNSSKIHVPQSIGDLINVLNEQNI
jgi:hypothetical protein